MERRRCDLAESIPRLQVPSEQCSATGTSRSTDDFDNEESCCAHSEELIGLEAEERLLRSRHERLLEEYLQANRKAGELQDGCDSASAEFALVDAANKSLAKESEECDAQLAGAADDLGALEARIARCEVRTSASLPEKLACLRAEASRLHQAIARPFCGTQAQAGFVASEAVQSATSKRRLNTIDSLSLRLDLSATNSMQQLPAYPGGKCEASPAASPTKDPVAAAGDTSDAKGIRDTLNRAAAGGMQEWKWCSESLSSPTGALVAEDCSGPLTTPSSQVSEGTHRSQCVNTSLASTMEDPVSSLPSPQRDARPIATGGNWHPARRGSTGIAPSARRSPGSVPTSGSTTPQGRESRRQAGAPPSSRAGNPVNSSTVSPDKRRLRRCSAPSDLAHGDRRQASASSTAVPPVVQAPSRGSQASTARSTPVRTPPKVRTPPAPQNMSGDEGTRYAGASSREASARPTPKRTAEDEAFRAPASGGSTARTLPRGASAAAIATIADAAPTSRASPPTLNRGASASVPSFVIPAQVCRSTESKASAVKVEVEVVSAAAFCRSGSAQSMSVTASTGSLRALNQPPSSSSRQPASRTVSRAPSASPLPARCRKSVAAPATVVSRGPSPAPDIPRSPQLALAPPPVYYTPPAVHDRQVVHGVTCVGPIPAPGAHGH